MKRALEFSSTRANYIKGHVSKESFRRKFSSSYFVTGTKFMQAVVQKIMRFLKGYFSSNKEKEDEAVQNASLKLFTMFELKTIVDFALHRLWDSLEEQYGFESDPCRTTTSCTWLLCTV